MRAEVNFQIVAGTVQEIDLIAHIEAKAKMPPESFNTDSGIEAETGIPVGDAGHAVVDVIPRGGDVAQGVLDAGRQADLVKEREMESAYNQALGRPELFIFLRDAGAHFDVLSIDFYRDLKHYAESADIPAEKQQAAARTAGYSSPDQIGPFLRSIIADHHDTLAVSVNPPQKK